MRPDMFINKAVPEAERTDRIEGVHKLPLLAAAGVAALSLFVVAGAQMSDGGKVVRTVDAPVAERSLLFRDASSGRIAVLDAGTGTVLATYGRGQGAFIRQSMRALTHNRRIRRLELGAPYSLQRAATGALTLLDPQTGKSIGLNAFGTVATGSFAPLLTATAIKGQDETGA